MQVHVADRSGFCFGVRRAIKIAEDSIKDNKSVLSLGPIIHNRHVVNKLHEHGLRTVNNIKSIPGGAVLVTSHGVAPDVVRKIKKKGCTVIDTTCPYVLRAQRIVREISKARSRIVIVGDKLHPEVRGIVGFASGKAIVINSAKEARAIEVSPNESVCVLSQTTQSASKYYEIVKILLDKRCSEIRVFNTICDDTCIRQKQAYDLAGKVDCIIVVGGKNSANTKRLLSISRNRKKNSHLIETELDLKKRWFSGCRTVGVASGASTPDWIIKKVVANLRKIKRVQK